MAIAIIIDESTNEVVNRIELEKGAKWEPPAGYKVVFRDGDIGRQFVQGKFKDAE